MRLISPVLILILLVSLCTAALADVIQGNATPIPHPTITVNADGTVDVAPDTERVTASSVAEGDTVEAARERNAQVVQKAMAAIKALNFANADVRTINYTMERITRDINVTVKVDPAKWDIPWKVPGTSVTESTFPMSVPVTLGYRASNSLTVRIHGGSREDLSRQTGQVIDALMNAGVNSITNVGYSLEKDNDAAQREALARAMKNAQATAEVVAAAAGKRIVGIRSINPSYVRPYQPEMMQMAFSRGIAGPGGPTPTTVTAGTLQISAQVNVVYDLEYNPDDVKIVPVR